MQAATTDEDSPNYFWASKKTLIAAALLMTAGLLVPLPNAGRIAGSLTDFLHVAGFAVMGAVVFHVLNARTQQPRIVLILVSWFLVSGFGLLTEFLQSFLAGRTASWHDLLADVSGGLAGILWVSLPNDMARARRVGLIALGCLMILLGSARPTLCLIDAVNQRREMPQLASFESPLELFRWSSGDSQMRRVRKFVTDGTWALEVELTAGKQFPGVSLIEPVADWSRWKELAMDVFLAGETSLDVTVKVQDAEHNNDYYDRFNRVISLSPGKNEIRISLADISAAPRNRTLELQQISAMSLFAVSPKQTRTVYLDHIRLQ